ncbi:E3 ubiquitin-protein ligase rnf8-like isoform X2 [Cimex lectularius]|uniref:E3 ubiquitin-protein ligase CHFR n=1 Tax=Cimex lectularius TaxID=79782 RepID=A0A8I6S067_CIMLE|nr:E3 ubiquitin-protein ligase rnf8-like isoform X2 [Cimex lectularius]
MSSEELPVLSDLCSSKMFHFRTSKFLIGRNLESDLDIPSQYISRKQCIFEKSGGWKITNLSALKTTLVNNKKVEEPVELRNGDVISFANYPSIELSFFSSLQEYFLFSGIKRKRLNETLEVNKHDHADQLKELKDNYQATLIKVEELNAQVTESNERANKCELDTKNLRNKNKELMDRIVQLEVDKTMLLSQCKENYTLLHECVEEINRMSDDRDELSKMLSESPLVRSKEYEAIKTDLDDKNSKINELEGIILKMAEEKEKYNSQVLMMVEQELSCCVCSDIMFEATILNCKHTLCKACLNEWKKKKKECPECRTKIKHETHNLLVDKFIERVAPLLGNSFVNRRKEIIRDRVANVNEVISIASHHNARRGTPRPRRGVRRRGGPYSANVQTSRVETSSRRRVDIIDLTSPVGGRRSAWSRANNITTNRD